MTSRDVREIMELTSAPLPSPLSLQPVARPEKVKRQKRPEGVTRELYALIGNNAPSLALAQSTKPKFKDRIKRSGPAKKWHWTSFTNPSRSVERPGDEGDRDVEARRKLVLKHWVRDLPTDYKEGDPDDKFAKFNTSSQQYSYTAEEYMSFLREDDWPKDETDYLFDLAREYDLRFIIMADRWEYGTERTIDDLKARYYSVCRRLIRNRPSSIDDATKNRILAELSFDKTRELDRKAYLRSLLSRTPAQIAEEDFLYIESRRLEQSYNKIQQERSDLLKILGGREGIGAQGGMNVGVGGGAKGSGSAADKSGLGGDKGKKKGGPGWEIEGLDGGGLPEGWAGEGSKRKATAAQDIANCIERHQVPSVSATKGALYPSVSLRSSRITQPKPAVLSKVQSALAELGISSTQLIMPTKNNIEKFDTLQTALTQLIELKKNVDRTDQEIKMYKKRKEGLLGINTTTSTAVSANGGDEVVVVKEEEGEGEKNVPARNKRSASAASSQGGTNKRARH